MELFLVVVVAIIIIQLFWLRTRVLNLEKQLRQVAEGAVRSPSAAVGDADAFMAATAHPELLLYIKDQFARGAVRSEVEASLVGSGWAANDVATAFSYLATVRSRSLAHVDAPPTGPDAAERFFLWLRDDWLLKLGALLLLIALGWFTTYAFMKDWIGDAGRISIGLLVGAAFLVVGAWRITAHRHQGGVFLVVGSTTILLTTFAARTLYDIFTPVSALAIMFLATAFVATMSVRYRSQVLAYVSLVLAALAPLLTSSAEPSFVSLFAYLFVVVLGTLGVVVMTGQRGLVVAALGIIFMYSLPHLGGYNSPDTPTLLLFAFGFAALFFLIHSAGLLRAGDKEGSADLVAAAGNGLFLICWIMAVAPAVWQSLLLSAWMVLFLVGAFLVYRHTGRREIFYVYSGVGLVMLAAATAAELSGPALVIAYTIQVAVVVIVSYLLLRSAEGAERTSLLFTVPVLLGMPSLGATAAWRGGVVHDDFFILVVLTCAFILTGTFFLARARETGEVVLERLGGVLAIIGSLYVYVLLWRVLHVVLPSSLAVMTALVMYTVVGITAYLSGLSTNKKLIKLYGGALVCFVVLRLLLVDVWHMEMAGRIITFAIVGVLLMSTAFLGKRKQ
ncbi:DUF2339 domain-containing protein [Patescibacteria group bacterium]|nr:DUF2339 domain-containing protein [Patescibacteria group bacterium]